MNLMASDVVNQRLDRHNSADNHQNGREDEGEPIQRFHAARVLLLEDDEVHPGGEDEGRDVVGEVTHHAENVAELRHEPRDERDQDDLHDAEDNVRWVGDEVLALGARAPVALHHLVDRLHPQREAADDRDHHHDVHRNSHPRAVRQRLQDVALHAVR